MHFALPSYYGKTDPKEPELTGRQKVASQGLDVVGQGLTQFFNWKTAQASGGMQPSQGGTYYDPNSQPPTTPNYTPVIITSVLLGTLVIGGIIWFNTHKGKKK